MGGLARGAGGMMLIRERSLFFGIGHAVHQKNLFRHPMLAALRKLLASTASADRADESTSASSARQSDVRLAACALLVELAKVDGEFSTRERQRILDILQRHFGLTADGAEELVAAAVQESRRSVDDFAFTRQVLRDYDLGQRMLLAELMWQVVLADGSIDSNESYLMRKLANLLQLDPAFLSEARRKTEQSLE